MLQIASYENVKNIKWKWILIGDEKDENERSEYISSLCSRSLMTMLILAKNFRTWQSLDAEMKWVFTRIFIFRTKLFFNQQILKIQKSQNLSVFSILFSFMPSRKFETFSLLQAEKFYISNFQIDKSNKFSIQKKVMQIKKSIKGRINTVSEIKSLEDLLELLCIVWKAINRF